MFGFSFGFSKALVGFIALMHGQVAALPQKAAPARAIPVVAQATPAPAKPAPAKPAPAPVPTPVVAQPIAPAPAAGPTAAQVVVGVQGYYKATSKLEAKFRQKFTNTVVGKTSISDGKVYIEKPGKMRWDYSAPDKKHYISDGTTLWVYEVANKQAFKQTLQNELLPVAITFLYGQGDLAKDFNASLTPGKFGGKGDLVVQLVPKAPTAQYKTLWLVVDPVDFHVKESVVEDVSNNLNSFAFSSVKTNADAKYVGAKLFKFTPPKGVKVITPPTPGPAAPPATKAASPTTK